jgi:hypothetical protein
MTPQEQVELSAKLDFMRQALADIEYDNLRADGYRSAEERRFEEEAEERYRKIYGN